MTMKFHGTPITPMSVFYTLAGRCFCVSFARPEQVERAHQIGQAVMLDNGAFSLWRQGTPTDWPGYYLWCDRWLAYPTTWAVIPDVIDGTAEDNDALIRQWPHGDRGAPVWHLHEPIDRLLALCDAWPRVCFGSSGQYRVVGSTAWHRRVVEAFNGLARRHSRLPWLHMLRGMQMAGHIYPFASLDSADIARNHNRPQNSARAMADRWDALQCPATWKLAPIQVDLLESA